MRFRANIFKLKIVITTLLCLSAALHTSLYAPIYDLTKNPTQMNQTWDEYKIKGNKSFSVKNNLDKKVYVRIGYKGLLPACEFTGFVLNPGQTGKILKSPICQPYIVSSGDTSIQQWNGYEDRLGDFMWTIDQVPCPNQQLGASEMKEIIDYQGKWSFMGHLGPRSIYDYEGKWKNKPNPCK